MAVDDPQRVRSVSILRRVHDKAPDEFVDAVQELGAVVADVGIGTTVIILLLMMPMTFFMQISITAAVMVTAIINLAPAAIDLSA